MKFNSEYVKFEVLSRHPSPNVKLKDMSKVLKETDMNLGVINMWRT